MNEIEKKTAEWGLKKFNPKAKKTAELGLNKLDTSAKKKTSNPFRQAQHSNQANGNKRHGKYEKNRDNERVKFNPIARDAKPDNATPWVNFKDQLNYKQREEQQATMQANMDTKEGKKVLEQREINYRKMLMEQKRQEPTSWEDFGDVGGNNDNGESGKIKKKKANSKQEEEIKETQSDRRNCDQSANKIKKKKKNKNNTSTGKADKLKFNLRHILPGGTSENFDIAKMTFQQKNTLRRLLTKANGSGTEDLSVTVKRERFNKDVIAKSKLINNNK